MSRPGQSYEPILAAWPLASIFADHLLRFMDYNRFNVDRVEGYVDGYSVTNANDAASSLLELCDTYMYDMCNFDGVLHIVPRGEAAVFAITDDDLIEDGGETKSDTRRDSISIPRILTVEYYDTDGGLTQDKQTSERALDSRASSEEKYETTVIMRADDAAKSVVIRHKVAVENARGEIKLKLPDSYLPLSTGDVGTFNGQRVRIDACEIHDDYQQYTMVYDRKNAYESTINGVPVETPLTPPGLIPDESRIELIDSHILNGQDDQLGLYLAVSSLGMDWPGAIVEMSRDGGQTWISSGATRDNAVMGVTTASFPVHSRYYPDNNNVLRVKLMRPDMELLPTDFRGMLNRFNTAIVGNEIINFSNVEQISEDEYELTGLLRGRKGSPVAVQAAGVRFVLLDAIDINFEQAELYDQGRTLTFRVTTIGREGPDQTRTIAYTGQSQVERQPEYLTARRITGGKIKISWQGVGKLGGGSSIGMGQYFTGYRLTVNGVAQETTARNVEVSDPGGTVTITVRQMNSITGAGPAASVTL